MIHSDHGSQFTPGRDKRAKDSGLLPSMGTSGRLRNASSSPRARMQTELLDRRRRPSHRARQMDLDTEIFTTATTPSALAGAACRIEKLYAPTSPASQTPRSHSGAQTTQRCCSFDYRGPRTTTPRRSRVAATTWRSGYPAHTNPIEYTSIPSDSPERHQGTGYAGRRGDGVPLIESAKPWRAVTRPTGRPGPRRRPVRERQARPRPERRGCSQVA